MEHFISKGQFFLFLFLSEQKFCHICLNCVFPCFTNFSRRRSRALSRANIRHDVRRGSRADHLVNVNEKRIEQIRQAGRSHRTPRDVSPVSPLSPHQRFVSPRDRRVRDERLPGSESPKSPRERREIIEDHQHEIRPPTPQVRIIGSSTESLMVCLQFEKQFEKLKIK